MARTHDFGPASGIELRTGLSALEFRGNDAALNMFERARQSTVSFRIRNTEWCYRSHLRMDSFCSNPPRNHDHHTYNQE